LTDRGDDLGMQLERLRLEFDDSFKVARPPFEAEWEDLLAIRLGREPFALRLCEVATIVAGTPVTPVPSQHPALLGLAGLRGVLVSVFDLGSLLGLARAPSAKWILRVKDSSTALGFAELEGQLRVPARDVSAANAHEQRAVKGQLHGVARVWPLLDLSGLVRGLERATGSLSEG
jgi:chemotaxis signal transduction protein